MEHPESLPGGRNAQKVTNNKSLSNNKISHPKADEPLAQKRSNVMETTRFKLRLPQMGWVAFVLLSLFVSIALGQNVTNTGTGTITNNGALNLTGALTVTGSQSGQINGTVNYDKAGPQTITPLQYVNLTASGASGAKTLGTGSTSVSGVFTVDITNGTDQAALGGQTLHLIGATPLSHPHSTFDFTAGTVYYDGNVDQDVLGTIYQNLNTSGTNAHTKTAGGQVTVSSGGSLTNAANTTLDFGANTFIGSGATLSTNSGILKSTGTVTIDATTAVGGTFDYYNSTTSQTIAPAYYTSLTMSGGASTTGQKNFSGLTKISGAYTVSGANRNYATGTSTVEFNGGTQTITGESNYYAVILSAAGTKTLATAMGLTNTFTHSAGQLDINSGGSLALGTTASFQALNINGTGTLTGGSGQATFSGAVDVAAGTGSITAGAGLLQFSSTLANAGTITVGSGKSMTLSSTFTDNSGTYSFDDLSTITYNASGAQNVVTTNYGHLALAGGNTKSLYGAVGIHTSLATSGTTNVIISTGTTTLSANASATFDGNLTTTSTFDASAAGTTTTFNGGAQAISGTPITFMGLSLLGTLDKTSSVNLTVNGAFTPTQGIAMTSSSILAIGPSGSVGTYGDLKEVTGLMTVNASAIATYKLNNEYTSIAFTNTESNRTFTLKNEPATAPFLGYAQATDVNRKVTSTYTNWTAGTATLQIAYRYGERATGSNSLRYFRNDPSVGTNKVGTGSTISRTAASIADAVNTDLGRISLAGIQPTAGSGSAYTKINSSDIAVMSARAAAFVTIAATADFGTGGTWDEGTVPGSSDDAVVNTTGITIANGATPSVHGLTINAAGNLTVGGGLSGTLAVGVGGLINNSAVGGHGLSVASGATVTITGGDLTNTGAITNDGTITVN